MAAIGIDTTFPVILDTPTPTIEHPEMPPPPPPSATTPTPTSDMSNLSLTDSGHVLTGKQEHYLKRELISRQVKFEIGELSSPTALQRFGAPFSSPLGEVAPVDSELPILRYIFVHNVRNFPFLDKAREKEFWQDKLQVFLESFASKRISSSEDRHEETKRRKLALKAEKLVELMMNSGIPTASGYEERITFKEIEEAGGPDRQANEKGLMANVPEGHMINGWDVNVCTVRQTSVKRTVRYHVHPEFIIRSKREGYQDVVVGRRYGAFSKLHHDIRAELPGKVLPPVPRKLKQKSTPAPQPSFWQSTGLVAMPDADDVDSIISRVTSISSDVSIPPSPKKNHKKSLSANLGISNGSSRNVSRTSFDSRRAKTPDPQNAQPVTLWRENQRVSLRAFLRTLLNDPQIAGSQAMMHFLSHDPITLNEEELMDEERRRAMDEIRLEEQKKFFEIASKRARELDVYMEGFRREIVENSGLTKLFAAIRQSNTIADLPLQYQKFAEWLRIEVAATIYHIFLAEDNSSEMFAQGKRIHSMIPYTLMKNIIRIANPAAVINGVLDLFLASPFGTKSLMQRIIAVAIKDGIRGLQKGIESLITKIGDPLLCQKLEKFVDSEEEVKDRTRAEAIEEQLDLVVVVLRSPEYGPEMQPQQIEKVFNGYVAFESAVENIHAEIKSSAHYFSNLKQLLKLYTRRRDKNMMLALIEEPVSLQLFRDLFSIFYEPLIRVYKSANVYNSVTDFADFVEDMIHVVEKAQSHDMATDPNVTVQSFIDLCQRHEDNFYKFVHEVHIHDDGLFENLMTWLEEILNFLRNGPKSGKKLDMNALFEEAAERGVIDQIKAREEINAIVHWQHKRRKWHNEKTKQKMASAGHGRDHWAASGPGGITPGDFGINDSDLDSLESIASDMQPDDEDEEDEALNDPIITERKKKKRVAETLKRRAGEPEKPVVSEILKLGPMFLDSLRQVLAD